MSKLKKCAKCKQLKPLEAFGKNKNNKDGLQSYCRECCAVRDKNYYKKHSEKKKERNKKIKEKNIEHYKEYGKKYREEHKEEIKQYRETHREEKRAIDKAYREAHKEEIKQYQKEYYKTEKGKAAIKAAQHKSRAKKKNVNDSFTSSEWLELCAEFNNKCAYCGIERNLTPDHVKPLNKGGENNINNIVPACIACNLEKNTNNLKEWFLAQTFFTQERYNKILEHIKED